MMRKAFPPLLLCLLVLTIAGILYFPVMQLGYVWDDNLLFVDNPALRTGDVEWAKLARPILPGTSYTRPLALWTFMAEFRLLGLSAVFSHAISYAFFLANVCLLLVLAWTHMGLSHKSHRAWRVALAGLLYAVHPALVEANSWVSGRFDLLATFFVLSGLLADLHVRRDLLRASAVAISFALALGSKEIGAALPALLIVQRLALEPATTSLTSQLGGLLRRHAHTVWLCALVGIVYVLIRLSSSGPLIPPTTIAEALVTPLMRVTYALTTLTFYVSQVFAPILGQTSPLHPAFPAAVFQITELAKAAAALVVLALIVWAALRRFYSGWMLLAALLPLLPVLNIVILPMAGNIGCDRFLTLPLCFVALAFAGLSLNTTRFRPLLIRSIAGAAVGVWAVISFANVSATIPIWRDDITLWGWLYENPETRHGAWSNYASALAREGQYAQARKVLDKQRSEGPLDAIPQMTYGMMLIMTGEPDEGSRYIEGSLSAFPKTSPPGSEDHGAGINAYFRDAIGFGHYALAQAKLNTGDLVGSLQEVDIALSYRPIAPDIVLLKSFVLAAIGRNGDAEAEFSRALALSDPSKRLSMMIKQREFANSRMLAPK